MINLYDNLPYVYHIIIIPATPPRQVFSYQDPGNFGLKWGIYAHVQDLAKLASQRPHTAR